MPPLCLGYTGYKKGSRIFEVSTRGSESVYPPMPPPPPTNHQAEPIERLNATPGKTVPQIV